MVQDSGVFNNLKEFAVFCLQHKFDELCTDYVLKLVELRNSTQTNFSFYSDEQILHYCKTRLEGFLKNAIEGSIANEIQQYNSIYKVATVENDREFRLMPEELIWDLAARKNSLINHVASFTNDLHFGLTITRELSLCNLLFEKEIINSFQTYQKQVLENNHFQLKHYEQNFIIERAIIEVISNNVDSGIFVFDSDLKITLWNSIMEMMNGISKDNALGKNILELFPKYKNQPEESAFQEVLNGNKVLIGGNRFKNINFFNATILPIKINNEVIGGVSLINDTSKKLALERQLNQKENSINELQEIVHLGTWEWIIRSNQLVFSDEVYRILGYAVDEIELSVDFLFNQLLEGGEELIRAVLLHSMNTLSPILFEIKIKNKFGVVRYLQVKGKVLAYKSSVPYKIVGHCWDITEQKEVEQTLQNKNRELAEKNNELNVIHEQLKKMNDELEKRVADRTNQLYTIIESLSTEISERKKMEQALKARNSELQRINEDLDQFIYAASHDLKAPISNIEGLVTTLFYEMDDLKSENKQIIDFIKQSILKFKETISDLSEIARSGKTEGEEDVTVDLRVVLQEVKMSIENLILSSRANFNDSGIVYPFIKFPKVSLNSILLNLISNAIKYRHPERNPEIEVECYRENDFVVLTVKDNGLGLNKEDKDKVFTMFKRIHNHVEGSGLGLYLVKRIVDNNGGKITLESEEGIGSKFRVYLKQYH